MKMIKTFSMSTILATALLSLSVSAGHHEAGEKKMKEVKAKMDDAKAMMKGAESAPAMDIVDTAVAAGTFSTLAKALTEAGLIETLKGEGPFTVFAPTDEAFAKIPEETLNAVLADKEKLTAILTYHVVAGKVMASDVVALDSATTVQGQSVAIKVGEGVMVNNANVVKTDIDTSNGVIHVIDTVLMPE